jgi:protein SERAC1
MGTPHAGSSIAPWASKLSEFIGLIKQTNSDILDPLKRDSAMLALIKEGFFEMLRVRRSEGKSPIQITCFFEQLPLPLVGTVSLVLVTIV